MNTKRHILFMFTLLLAQVSFGANENTSMSSLKADSQKSLKRNFGVSAGYYNLNNEFSSGKAETLHGFAINGSKEFRLTERVSTTSRVLIGRVSNENSNNSVNTETTFSHVGTFQQVSYQTNFLGSTFLPYVGLGFDIGRYTQDTDGLSAEEQELLGIKDIKTEADFLKYYFSLGAELVISRNFSPFLSYSIGAIIFENISTVASGSGSKDDVKIEGKLDNIQTQALTMGLNYYF